VYRCDDREAILDLNRTGLAQVGIRPGDGVYSDDDLRDVELVYLDGRGEFLVGELERRIVAMGGIRYRNETTAELARMRTHPDVQRRGYARALLHRLEQSAVALGYRHLWLVTGTHQEAAISLYLEEGYLRTGGSRYADMDAVHLEKHLPDAQPE
jgi:GNAT superfamily N-acetyltransferase